ncbi:MAG: 50S ribosomal protein L6 [Spirochaetae bacterium HGW-Spirochaetae-1]|jgi:large subunit ribosomal protein L6|nr:MAG: 50S ribosomal protein L6 [Spirochaetae bacterium HGW-Spirochaetae-1]
MSRIGKKPIQLPSNVTVDVKDRVVNVKGPLGEDNLEVLEGIIIKQENNVVLIQLEKEEKQQVAFQGLYRSLISNMVVGTSQGFEKDLEIVGVGYRATQQGANIQFQLGYSHHIIFEAPDGIKLEVVDPTKIKIKGINKQRVGQVAANIRKLRPPEPYKGKGIRYKNEQIRKKAGKAGK